MRTPVLSLFIAAGVLLSTHGLSSQRSEADAQAAFRSLKNKYPGQLGNQEVVIRRMDLGEKGIYYRALVGPFASVEQATEMCGSLKAVGGQCVVQKN